MTEYSNKNSGYTLAAALKRNKLERFLPFEDKLQIICDLLAERGKSINLTALREPADVYDKHIADSLLAERFIGQGDSLVDVGCGAGFPSLVLAACRQDLRVTALDSTAKKLAFTAEAAAAAGLDNLTTLCGRAEDVARREMRESFDTAIARAVAPLNVLCELCLPLVKPGGKFVAMKGADISEELPAAARAIELLGGEMAENIAYTLHTQSGTQKRVAVIIQKTAHTPKIYPRDYSKINKKPI